MFFRSPQAHPSVHQSPKSQQGEMPLGLPCRSWSQNRNLPQKDLESFKISRGQDPSPHLQNLTVLGWGICFMKVLPGLPTASQG